MEEIPSVFVADVGTVPFPEKWLVVFDRVRGMAMQCHSPDMIFRAWEWRYVGGGDCVDIYTVDEIIDDETYTSIVGGTIRILRWIRDRVREEAQKEGLL